MTDLDCKWAPFVGCVFSASRWAANDDKIGAESAPILRRWFWRSGLEVMILLYAVPQGSQTELW